MIYSFFFQAEDGIRDGHVTGVQTCALPISGAAAAARAPRRTDRREPRPHRGAGPPRCGASRCAGRRAAGGPASGEIGRASCRERGEITVEGADVKKNETEV